MYGEKKYLEESERVVCLIRDTHNGSSIPIQLSLLTTNSRPLLFYICLKTYVLSEGIFKPYILYKVRVLNKK